MALSGLVGSSCPVTKATAEAASRWVTGMPAYAGAATPAVTPGTTSKATPAVASASASSPRPAPKAPPRRGERLRLLAAAAEHERVAALEPHHPAPGAAQLDQLL